MPFSITHQLCPTLLCQTFHLTLESVLELVELIGNYTSPIFKPSAIPLFDKIFCHSCDDFDDDDVYAAFFLIILYENQ